MSYYNGRPLPQNYKKAKFWLEKSAAQGITFSKLGLISMYMLGEGVEQDYRIANKLIEEIAQTGDPGDLYTLGDMYYRGIAVGKNYDLAFAYFLKSAEKGYVAAFRQLGNMFRDGEAIQQNYEMAAKMFLTAAEGDCTESMYLLGNLYFENFKDYDNAKAWFSKAAQRGHAEAQCFMGIMYRNILHNDEMAFLFFAEAARKESTLAKIWLGYMLSENFRYIEAVPIFESAAMKGNLYAIYNLATIYLFGVDGIPRNVPLAFELFSNAATQYNHMQFINGLGLVYEYGDFGDAEQNNAIAFSYYSLAASAGCLEAMHNLGLMYLHGKCVGKNIEKAKKWFQKAADCGLICSIEMLQMLSEKEPSE
jgi:TPR repeat protein